MEDSFTNGLQSKCIVHLICIPNIFRPHLWLILDPKYLSLFFFICFLFLYNIIYHYFWSEGTEVGCPVGAPIPDPRHPCPRGPVGDGKFLNIR